MKRDEALNLIKDILNSSENITESSVISECQQFDSLCLLNIFLEGKKAGADIQITDFVRCKTVSDILDLLES